MSDSPFSATNDCARWRADVLSALQQLQPKVVIIANLNSLYVEQSLPNMTIEETQFTWGSELTRTLEGLSGLGAQVIIAQPPPQFAYDLRYNTSLLWPDPSKEPRDVAIARRAGMNEIEVNATIGIEHVVGVFNFDDVFCNAKFCDPQVKNKFMFEDSDHLSVDGSLLVESKIRSQIRLALVK
jgi:hypothetical protein